MAPLRISQRVAAIVVMVLSAAPLVSAGVVVTNGNAQTIALNDAVAGTLTAATSYPCWFTGTGVISTPIASTDCTGTAGSATAFGALTTMVCAAAGTAWSVNWDVAANPHVSIIECTNTINVANGAAAALSFTTSTPTAAPTSAPTSAPTPPTSAPTSAPSTAPTTVPTTSSPTKAPSTPAPTMAGWTYADMSTNHAEKLMGDGVLLSHATFDYENDVKYGANLDNRYVEIHGSSSELIVMNFSHIEIEGYNGWKGDPSNIIYYDYLDFHDGVYADIDNTQSPTWSSSTTRINRISGYHEEGDIYRSRSHIVTIIFKTDAEKNFNGWRMEWYASTTSVPTSAPTVAPTETLSPTPLPTKMPTQTPPSTVVDNIIGGVTNGTIADGLKDAGSIVTDVTCTDSLSIGEQVEAEASGLITGTCTLTGTGLSVSTFGLSEQAKLKDEIAAAGGVSGSQITLTSITDTTTNSIGIVFIVVPQDGNVAPGEWVCERRREEREEKRARESEEREKKGKNDLHPHPPPPSSSSPRKGTLPTPAPTVFTAAMCGNTGDVAKIDGDITLAVFLSIGLTALGCSVLFAVVEVVQLWMFCGSCHEKMEKKRHAFRKAKRKREKQKLKRLEAEAEDGESDSDAEDFDEQSNPLARGGKEVAMTQIRKLPPAEPPVAVDGSHHEVL